MFVRADIPLADQLVQVAHACLEAGSAFGQPETPPNLVLFGVSSEERLREAVGRFELAGIRCVAFFEPDDDMGYTAACTEPVSGEDRRLLRRYSLWRSVPGKSGAFVDRHERGPPAPASLPLRKHFKPTEVLSKVLLLARDTEIKDPTILEQILATGA